jgi:hypothetical protein
VRTAPNQGATFRIALPLSPEARDGAAADDDPDLDEAGDAVAEAGEDVVAFGGKVSDGTPPSPAG